ncbi:MAG: polysaccharide deacetylase family protein [Flavisolibacter sp.]
MSYAALIFSHSITPRLRFVVDFLSQYYGLSLKLISDEEKYRDAKDACKINYSYHQISSGEIFIHSHVLLFETSIRPVKIECFEIRREPQASQTLPTSNSYKAFFRTHGDFEFDLLAGIFYLISRYEEYLPHKKDMFGRYAHENSLAFKENFLHLPLINIWLEDFRTILARKNPEFNARKPTFSFVPTYDIDMAWSFRNKGLKRNAGAITILFLKAKFRSAIHRIKVLRRKKPDPFDAYEWMDNLHESYRVKPFYFFLVAKEKSRFDKNIHPSNEEFIRLIRSISSRYQVGLHPSWASGDESSLLEKERHSLEHITSKHIEASRQHFIRMQLPSTYQNLLNAGIQNDYSMGYGSINGFRASIASPFYWYDLKNDTATNLLIHSFCFMDANAYYEEKLSAEEALKQIMWYYEVIKSVNGTMITIWHNSFLGTAKEFEGWREVYEEFVRRVVNRES